MYLGHGNRFVGGHLHTIGNRCWCGYLTIPVGFHTRDGTGQVADDGKGEAAYLGWLASSDKPGHVNPPVMEEIRGVTKPPPKRDESPVVTKVCDETPKGGRPKKYRSRAAQQAAYRGRHEDTR